jgi:hypothetical protein
MIRGLIMFFATIAGVLAGTVDVPRGLDHGAYDRLLKKYVNERGLVDYKSWKTSADDLKALREYTGKFAGGGPFDEGNEKAATLINAYNALTIQWILDNYPTPSIRALPDSFGEKRHLVGGRKVSLNEIEHDTLRPLLGYRVHATLVCAARSCPPLRVGAYESGKLDDQLDDAMQRWLAREDLNRFLPAENHVEISSIFKWFAEDFQKAGGVKKVLAKYGPERYRSFLQAGEYRIEYLPYRWGLNDQSDLGKDYGTAAKVRDSIRNLFR